MISITNNIFQDCVITAEVDFWKSSSSYRGILWPFSVKNHFQDFWDKITQIYSVFQKCHFRWCVARLILKLTQNYAQKIWVSFWGLRIVRTTFERVKCSFIRNSFFISAELQFQRPQRQASKVWNHLLKCLKKFFNVPTNIPSISEIITMEKNIASNTLWLRHRYVHEHICSIFCGRLSHSVFSESTWRRSVSEEKIPSLDQALGFHLCGSGICQTY